VTGDGGLVALRPREPGDAATLTAWFEDAETMRWWDQVYPPLPVESFAARIAAAGRPSYHLVSFMVLDAATGTPIGWSGLMHASVEHRHAALGILIGDPAYRSRGYGTAATRAVCRFGFAQMNLARITLTVIPENVAARAAYARAGFVEEGVQRQALWKRGAWHELVHMSVFAESLR
jgi:RimJ/RimL family protein N-acetyltransferase